MTDYTPTTEEMIRFWALASPSRGMSVREREAAGRRALAAHDAEVRAALLAEQGEPEWEYGSAVREANGVVWDHEFFTKDPTTAAQLRAWSEEHSADGWDDSTIVAVRRSIPRVEVWEPVEENTPHTEGNER